MSGNMGAFSRRVAIGTVLTLAVVIGLCWRVGYADRGPDFNWELAAVFGTAVGTTLLAITTGALAFFAGRDVSATQDLAKLQRDEQQARERPVVLLHAAVFQPSGDSHSPNEGRIGLQLFNAGLGPALRVEVVAAYKDPAYAPQMSRAVWPVVMAGTRSDIAIDPIRFQELPPAGSTPMASRSRAAIPTARGQRRIR
jgi:hypothetical protein